ncbi:unnamed protein product [Chrysodeixis includens]|uniref:SH3 domain-containing protein n=1 Tax=Chrysodeixis includens TaxID=689277 RepID=A0A9N8KZ62_CHRIL|nr:unnamed protein product [Chrysodeixis includens]
MTTPDEQVHTSNHPSIHPTSLTLANLPAGALYRVRATYRYTREDEDELSFDVGELIRVVEYDDPDEQVHTSNHPSIHPTSLTLANLPAGALYRVRATYRYTREDEDALSFDVGELIRVVEYDDPDEQVHTSNHPSIHPTSLTLANLPAGALYRVRATYRYTREDEDERSFDVGELIRVVEYDDPDEQVHTSNHPSIHPTSLTLANLPAGALYRVRATYRYTREDEDELSFDVRKPSAWSSTTTPDEQDEDELSFDVGELIRVVEYDDPDEQVHTSNHPSIHPTSLTLANLPAGALYRVRATYRYTREDEDELSFDVGELIRVVEYDDPDEQVHTSNHPSIHPTSLTLANLPAGALYRVRATYRYTREDEDELSFDVGELIRVVEYDDPDEQVHTSNHPSIHPPSLTLANLPAGALPQVRYTLTLANLPAGALYRVRATYRYTREDEDELSFDVGELIRVVEYDDPDEQVHTSNHPSIHPTSLTLANLPAGALYRVRATCRYTREDEDELSFDVGELIRVVEYDDPDEQVHTSNHPSIHPTSLTLANLPAGALYRVRATYRYTREDEDELSFDVGALIRVVEYDDPDEQVHTSNHPSIHPTSLTLANLPAGALYRVRATYRYTREDEDELSFDVGELIRVVDLTLANSAGGRTACAPRTATREDETSSASTWASLSAWSSTHDPDEQVYTIISSNHPSIHPTSLTLANLPAGALYRVRATYRYTREDEDELSFDVGALIRVVEYDDPDEQVHTSNHPSIHPTSLTLANLPAGALYRVRATYRYTREDEDELSFDVGELIRVVEYDDPDEQVHTSNHPSIHPTSLTLANLPAGALYRVRATYRYTREDEDELSFDVGELIRVVEYDDPDEQVHTSNHPSIHPTSLTLANLPAGALYRVRATYRYTREDEDERSFDVGELIRVVEYDDPDEQVHTSNHPSIHPTTSLTLANLPAGVLYRVRATYRYTREDEDELSFDVAKASSAWSSTTTPTNSLTLAASAGALPRVRHVPLHARGRGRAQLTWASFIRVVEYDDPDEQVHTSNHPSIHPTSLTLANLPAGALYRVRATYRYTREDEDELSFDVGALIRVVEYDDPDEQVHTSNHPSIHPTSLTLANLPAGALYRVRATYRYTREDEDELSFDVASFIRVVEYDDPGRTGTIHPNPSIHPSNHQPGRWPTAGGRVVPRALMYRYIARGGRGRAQLRRGASFIRVVESTTTPRTGTHIQPSIHPSNQPDAGQPAGGRVVPRALAYRYISQAGRGRAQLRRGAHIRARSSTTTPTNRTRTSSASTWRKLIRVVEYDDPDEQVHTSNHPSIHPTSLTLANLPAGALYRVRATYRYTREDADELSFDPDAGQPAGGRVTAQVRFHVPLGYTREDDELSFDVAFPTAWSYARPRRTGTTTSNHPSIHPTSLTLANLPAGALYRVRANVPLHARGRGRAQLRRVAYPRGRVRRPRRRTTGTHTSNHPSIHPTSLTLANRPAGALYRVRATYRYTREDEDELSFDVGELIRVVEYDDPDEQVHTSNHPSIHPTSLTLANLPAGALYRVRATYRYTREDEDELSFDVGELIRVVEYDDPDEQVHTSNHPSIHPTSLTLANLPAGALYRVRATYRYTREDEDELSFDVGELIRVVEYDDPDEQVHTSNHPSIHPTSLTLANLPAGALYRVRATYRYTREDEDELSFDVGELIRVVEYDDPDEQVHTSNHPSIHPTSLTLANLPAGALYRVRATYRYTREDEDELSFDVGELIRVVEYDDPDEQVHTSNHPSIHPTSLTLANLPAGALYRVRATYRYTREDEDELSFDVGELIRVVEYDDPDEQVHTSNHPSIHPTSLTLANLPAGALYRVRATYRYTREDEDELSFDVGELIRVVEYDDPDEQVHTSNHPSIHPTSLTLANLPAGALYRVRATYRYTREDEDELSFDVGELIRVVEYDDPDEQVHTSNHPSIHPTSLTLANLPAGALYRVRATYRYTREDEDELSFDVGELIRVVEYDDPDEQVHTSNHPSIHPTSLTLANLPAGALYRVRATYRYTREDEDELSFDVGELIRVVEYDDPDEQVHTSNHPSIHPTSLTLANLPAGALYRVRATYRYTREDEDELSFDVGELIRVVEYDDPDEQEEGWLMGIKESTNEKGMFPANFTRPI